jgi:ComF family protein
LGAAQTCEVCHLGTSNVDELLAAHELDTQINGNALFLDDGQGKVTWHLDACYCAVDYQYPWSQCVSGLKYAQHSHLARPMAELMQCAPHVELCLEQADWVIPVPVSRQRLNERGFNQSSELARHLSRRKTQHHGLIRQAAEAHQVGASRQQRLSNLHQAFCIASQFQPLIKDRRITLIDDVLTTGATLNEAARTLKVAGAVHVSAIVFARTPARTN